MPLRAPPGPASAKGVFQSSLLGVAGARPAGTIRNLQGVWPEGRMPAGAAPGFLDQALLLPVSTEDGDFDPP